jgi:UDP-2-acetamido-2,6-beta-L-arabino-hexul-4-ose reductase
MPVALTGAGGFLGWHTRCALLESRTTANPLSLGDLFDETAAALALEGTSRLIHVAGVNRGTDDEVRDGNVRFAEQVAHALARATTPPPVVVFANSTQSLGAGVYGEAKKRASEIVAAAAQSVGAEFVDVVLPNLFGEHGKPFYNAVTATFAHLLAEGGDPTVENDRELTLLHVQNAADELTGAASLARVDELRVHITVSELLSRLQSVSEIYRNGEIPDVADKFSRDLFNTYRSHTFPRDTPVRLVRHADARGSFFEIIRSHGGPGQSSFSTTHPGVSRGDHFHRRKIERFTVLSGQAVIALRRVFTDQVVEFRVTGDAPVAVDMPTMWSHNIINTESEPLYTSFWTNDIFDPASPDTIPEAVHR